METTHIRRTVSGNQEIYEISRKMETPPEIILGGWPHDFISLANIQDMLAVYHELGLHRVLEVDEPLVVNHRRWYLAGQIVARIQRDNRER